MAIQKLEKQVSSADPLLENNHNESHVVHHPVPMNWCLESWELGRQFTDGVKFGIVQYVSVSCLLKDRYVINVWLWKFECKKIIMSYIPTYLR